MVDPEYITTHSLAEYMRLEEVASFRSEFYNGEILAMAESSPEHSRITTNCLVGLSRLLDGSECEVYESSLMVHIPKINTVLYPDASVVCGPLDRDPQWPNLVRNPNLILEVLSKSTTQYDRSGKFMRYRMIPTLQTYVLIEQAEPSVYVGYRGPHDEWGFRDYFGLDEVVEFQPLGISLPMREIYRRTGVGE